MVRSFLLLIATLAVAGCGSAPKCTTFDAQGVVNALRSKEQFRSILKAVVERTHTAAAMRRNGSENERLSGAIDASVERHHHEWEQNLVSAWGKLSPHEIAEVCAALGEGDSATFTKFADRVGASVQKANGPLLKKAGAEVLSEIF